MNNFFTYSIITLVFGTSLVACEPNKEALEEKSNIQNAETFSPVVDRRKHNRPRP